MATMADRHVPGDRLSAFLDDELPEQAALATAHHLADCTGCMDELDQLRATRDALRGLPTVPAPQLLPAAAEVAAVSTAGSGPRWRSLRLVVLGAIVPLIAVFAVYVVGTDSGEVEPATDRFLIEHVGLTGGGPVPRPVGVEP